MLRGSLLARALLKKGMTYSTLGAKRTAGHSATAPSKATASKKMARIAEPTPELIASMVRAGAKMEGGDICIVRTSGVDSEAWKIYKDWACSLEGPEPIARVRFTPPPAIATSSQCPAPELVDSVLAEAQSIIDTFDLAEFDLPPEFAGEDGFAMIALLQKLSNPGANFPVIDSLAVGQYVCHVTGDCDGIVGIVSVFRA